MTEEITVFSDSDQQAATSLAADISETILTTKTSQVQFMRGFARLGRLLHEVRTKKYWILWGYGSFGKYIDSIKIDIDKGRSQIYNAISASEKLLPYCSEEQIEIMGITKASELSRMLKDGRTPTAAQIEFAANPENSHSALRAQLFQKTDEDKGRYHDWGGCYLTPDEEALVDRAFACAARIDPVIPITTPTHLQIKEIMLRFCQEFLSTYEAAMSAGQG